MTPKSLSKAINDAAKDEDIFPVQKKDTKKKNNDNNVDNNIVMLYIAELINIECHAQIKCAKYKVGYIIRDKMQSNHKSRLTHITPYANFFWYSVIGIPKSDQSNVAKDWEYRVNQAFKDQNLLREVFRYNYYLL